VISRMRNNDLHRTGTLEANISKTVIHCVSKNRTLEIFSNISNKPGPISIIFGTENRSINMLRLMLTILQYVVKQRTSLGFPLATRTEAGAP